jgi:hypothetical protein
MTGCENLLYVFKPPFGRTAYRGGSRLAARHVGAIK